MIARRAVLAAAAAIFMSPGEVRSQDVPGSPYERSDGSTVVVPGGRLPKILVYRFLPVTLPLAHIRVTQLYGLSRDPILGYNRFHPGVDFGTPIGTPVYATAAGTVSFADPQGGYGDMVEVGHAFGFSTRYAHLSRIDVVKGQTVDRNSVLGLSGSSGRSTGPHLHFEIRRNGEPLNVVAFILRAQDLYATLH